MLGGVRIRGGARRRTVERRVVYAAWPVKGVGGEFASEAGIPEYME